MWCSKAAELGILTPPNVDTYVEESLTDALAHEYRAFFDICDWLSMNLRKRLIDLLQPYDNETINSVIPKYYEDIRPRCDSFCSEIAKLRTAKDIGLPADIIAQTEKYNRIIQGLMEDVSKISQCVPALEEYKSKKGKRESKGYWKEVGLLAIGAVLLAVAEWFMGFFSKGK